MHVDLKCQLEDGRIEKYTMALRVGSNAAISRHFTYIGSGVIHSVDGVDYTGRDIFHFYKTKKGRGNR